MFYLFNNIKRKDILDSYLQAINSKNQNDYDACISKLLEFALDNSITGNIWQAYILYTIIMNENSFTKSCERGLKLVGTPTHALLDITKLHELFYSKEDWLNPLFDFQLKKENSTYLAALIDEFGSIIRKDPSIGHFGQMIISFFKTYGVGDMAIYRAFRIENGDLVPIYNVSNISFDELIGYESQKKKLIDNTENFVSGNSYNNVLLYGDSGTGKSTSIKALLSDFFTKGLRIIEVYKHQMSDIPKIINKLRTRNYYYIIYMDDLSFEDDEVEYKFLKSVIEGGIEPKPDNVAIYATSNRRHLIKETKADNGDYMDDLHRNETQAEKLSLAYRFGLQIYYGSLTPQQFRQLVIEMARQNDLDFEEEELLKEAQEWELTYGSLSGRCAAQFINHMKNKKPAKKEFNWS